MASSANEGGGNINRHRHANQETKMQIVDAHHHLWNQAQHPRAWLTDPVDHIVGDYNAIRGNYLIDDFHRDADGSGYELVKSVHVEAAWGATPDPADETAWLQTIADTPGSRGMPHAIIAHANLLDPEVESLLQRHCTHSNMRGIRQMLNHSADTPGLNFIDRGDVMQDPQWQRGYATLKKLNLSFDLQIWPWQLEAAAELVGRFPEIPVILNHTGMPLSDDFVSWKQWAIGMDRLAEFEHVAVKISGLGMARKTWTVETIRPYVEGTLERFGIDRCMFASNFPVDCISSDYARIWSAFDAIAIRYSEGERQKIFHTNAERIYRI